jgi:hypothetical protein
MSNPLHWIDSILLIKVILSGAGFRRHQNFRGKNASNQSSRTKGSDVLATHCVVNWDNTLRQSGESEADCAARHCISRPPPGATPSQSERTSTPHADRSTNSTSRGRMGRSTSGAAAGAPAGLTAASVAGAAAAPAIGGAALPAHGSDGLLAICRDSRSILFQALQCGGTAGRHTGANLRIIASARAADSGNPRIAWLPGCRGVRLGDGHSRLFLGCSGRVGLCLGGDCGRLGFRFRRSSDGAHGALTARRKA